MNKRKENPARAVSAEELVLQAINHWDKDEIDKAIALCDMAIEQDKNLAWGYNIRGFAYAEKDDKDKGHQRFYQSD